jgi:hypothetical protein
MDEIVTHTDETLVPDYTLPDPLTFDDGEPVKDAENWMARRRSQILDLFEHHVYGRMPDPPKAMDEIVTAALADADTADGVLDGLATRKQITVRFTDEDDGPEMHILVYLPADRSTAVPLFVGLNFVGNHTIHPDPGIALATGWVPEIPALGNSDNRATENGRGRGTSRWPVEMILKRGYGLATIYCGDIDPDFHDGFQNGVHTLFPRDDSEGDAWGTIGAWAWGLSRALDVFVEDEDIDGGRVAVIGHSRLGKTALWAGASDPRFAMVVPNNSGCGGAAISRRGFGETVLRINTVFPHWFCTNFKQYNDREADLPIDQHELIALVAPRPVYVASASEDLWSDPKGEFLAAKAADPVYKLLGTEGLPTKTMPPINTPVQGKIAYHIRDGKHDITAYDWRQYLDFADNHLK